MKTSKTLFLLAIALASFATYAQKTISVGAKVGVPNLVSGSAELQLPFLNKFSVYADLSKFDLVAEDLGIEDFSGSLKLNYFEYGANLYLSKPGRGAYISAGLASFNADASFFDVALDGTTETGSGTASIGFNTTNFKFGVKTGGLIYFRMELGYAMGSLPQSVSFNARSSSGITETITETFNYDDIPMVSENGLPLFNIGLGVSF